MSELRAISRNPIAAARCLLAYRRGDDPDENVDAFYGAALEGAALGSQIAWADEQPGGRK